MKPLHDLTIAVVRKWSAEGVTVRPGVTVAELTEFGHKYGVRLPEDFAALWRAANGMGSNDTDEELIRFWPLEEVRPALDERRAADPVSHKSLFIFADYSISAHDYAIKLEPNRDHDSSIAIVGADQPIYIARSFTEFLEKYLQGDVFPTAP